MVTVTKLPTPTQDEADKYCTVEDVHRITNISMENLKAVNINSLVKTASAIISTRIGGKIGLYEISGEVYSGNYLIDYMGKLETVNYMQLNNNNISSIVSLAINGVSVTPGKVLIDNDTIYLKSDAEVTYFPTYEIGSVVITYRCGNYNINTENIIKLLTQTLTSLLLLRTPQGRNLYIQSTFSTEFGQGEFSAGEYDETIGRLDDQVKFLFTELGIKNIYF
jgi:hypothetical protein